MAQRVMAPGPGPGPGLGWAGLGWAGPKRLSTWKASALPKRTGVTVAGNDHGRVARSATPSRSRRFGTVAELGSPGWVAVGGAADSDSGGSASDGSASDGSAEGAASATAGRGCCAAQRPTSRTIVSRRNILSRALVRVGGKRTGIIGLAPTNKDESWA